MQGFAHPPGRHLPRWGTVRLRMTLWNVAVLALILGAMGSVVRYRVQADRLAAVDRTLAERAHEAGRRYAAGPPAGRNTCTTGRSRVLDPMTVATEGSLIGSTSPGALPPLLPRMIPRDRVDREHWDKPWIGTRSLVPSPAGPSIRPSGMAARRRGYCRSRLSAGARLMRCFSSPIRSTAFCGRSTG